MKDKITGKIGKIINGKSYVDNVLGGIEYEIRLKGNIYYLNAFNVEETTEQEKNDYLTNEVVDTL